VCRADPTTSPINEADTHNATTPLVRPESEATGSTPDAHKKVKTVPAKATMTWKTLIDATDHRLWEATEVCAAGMAVRPARPTLYPP
jgi:hypothetical protein